MAGRVIGVLAWPWPIPATGYGGAELVLDGLCRGLVAAGHEVRLWASPESTCPVPLSGISLELDQTKGWHSAPIEMAHVVGGYQWLAEQGVEIVHDVTLAGPLLARSLTDVPVVTTNYLPFTPPLPGHGGPDLSDIYRAMGAAKIPILAVSHGQAAGAEGFQPHVIHLGIDVADVPVGNGSGDDAGPYAVFLGRMSPEKGVRQAVLAARAAGIRLKIAARMTEDHEHRYYRSEVAELVDGRQVEYLGELGGAAKFELLRNAAALVYPIAWPEPFGLVMIESLMTGTPVVTMRRGSTAELIETGVTGAVCDSFDELVDALAQYQSFDRQVCRAHAVERFSTERMTRDHVAYYESVIAGA